MQYTLEEANGGRQYLSTACRTQSEKCPCSAGIAGHVQYERCGVQPCSRLWDRWGHWRPLALLQDSSWTEHSRDRCDLRCRNRVCRMVCSRSYCTLQKYFIKEGNHLSKEYCTYREGKNSLRTNISKNAPFRQRWLYHYFVFYLCLYYWRPMRARSPRFVQQLLRIYKPFNAINLI